MAIGLIIIGDEIMSGKYPDKHFGEIIKILKARGLKLDWAQYLGDDPIRITNLLKQTFANDDIVFSCGGIGSTPDDHTRECAAKALNLPLVLHEEAKECIISRIKILTAEGKASSDLSSTENKNRLKMGEFPQGAKIIPNTFNNIPGFSIGTHYFVPGFPEMAWNMIAWALDTYHSNIFHQNLIREKSLILYEVMEAKLSELMKEIEKSFPDAKTFSLPKVATKNDRAYIEFGIKGNSNDLENAFAQALEWMKKQNIEYRRTTETP